MIYSFTQEILETCLLCAWSDTRYIGQKAGSHEDRQPGQSGTKTRPECCKAPQKKGLPGPCRIRTGFTEEVRSELDHVVQAVCQLDTREQSGAQILNLSVDHTDWTECAIKSAQKHLSKPARYLVSRYGTGQERQEPPRRTKGLNSLPKSCYVNALMEKVKA